MRQITYDAVKAFLSGYNFKRSNTEVKYHVEDDRYRMYLHGNCIAEKLGGRSKVYISCAGWTSNTTKERLNGILDTLNKPRIYQKDWVWYWKNGESFDTDNFQEVI
jgi:DNA-binding LacI/PurR family transcriptional regulator